MNANSGVQAIRWDGERLFLLDQRLLPTTVVEIELRDAIGVAEAIRNMVVRGAPAIGVAAAYGGALSVAQHGASQNWRSAVEADLLVLEQAFNDLFTVPSSDQAGPAEGFSQAVKMAVGVDKARCHPTTGKVDP